MCVSKRYTHTHPHQHNTNVCKHRHAHTLHSYHPLRSTKHSMGMLHVPPGICTHTHTRNHLLSMCPRIYSNCFQMQRLPLLVFLSLEFVVLLSILLCLPSNFPGRSYSRGENKLPHLPLCTSCTLTRLLNPTHRCRVPQNCGHSSWLLPAIPQGRSLRSGLCKVLQDLVKQKKIAQHVGLCFYSPSLSFLSGKSSPCLLTI